MMKRTFFASLPVITLAIMACSETQGPVTPGIALGDGAVSAVRANPSEAAAKVDICHRANESKGFILVSVAPTAVGAHLAHGDGEPDDPFPGQPGMRFAANCAPEVIPFNLTLTTGVRATVRDTGSRLVRDGSGDSIFLAMPPRIQVYDTPDYQDRAVLEFDISTIPGTVGHAELRLPINDGFPDGVFLAAYWYQGDGAATLSDFAAGTFAVNAVIRHYMPPGTPVTQVTLDVTGAVQSLVMAKATFAGFTFRGGGGLDAVPYGGIAFDAFVPPNGPGPTLTVRSP